MNERPKITASEVLVPQHRPVAIFLARAAFVVAAIASAPAFGATESNFGGSTSQYASSQAMTSVTPGGATPEKIVESTRQTSEKRTREGIQVHGYWSIEVHNPDGTLDKHVEFENSLCHYTPATGNIVFGNYQAGTPGGDWALTSILTGFFAAGGWSVQLGNAPLPSPAPGSPIPQACTSTGLPGTVFTLMQTLQDPTGICVGNCFMTLSKTLANPGVTSLTMNGNFVVPTGGATTITAVGTVVQVCSTGVWLSGGLPTCLVSAYAGPSVNSAAVQITGAYLTGIAPLPPSVSISDGQTVGVTVVLSFQ